MCQLAATTWYESIIKILSFSLYIYVDDYLRDLHLLVQREIGWKHRLYTTRAKLTVLTSRSHPRTKNAFGSNRLGKNKTHSNDMLPYDRVSLHLWKTCRCCKCFSRNESENLRDNASENSKNRISEASRLEVSPLFHAHVIFRPLREVTFAAQPRQFVGLPFLRETVLAFHLWAPIIISYHADSQSS